MGLMGKKSNSEGKVHLKVWSIDLFIVLFSPSLLADAALSGAATVLKYSQSVE